MASIATLTIPDFESYGFPKKSRLESFSWDIIQASPGSGRPKEMPVERVIVARKEDDHSNLFYGEAASGKYFAKIHLFLMTGTEKTVETFLTYTFEDCTIADIRVNGSVKDGVFLEFIEILFKKAKYDHKKI